MTWHQCVSPPPYHLRRACLSFFTELGNPVSAGSVLEQKELGWGAGVLQLKQREAADTCWYSSPHAKVPLHPLALQQLDCFARNPVEAK